MQFIPARGRKRERGRLLRARGIAIYPREGTETRFRLVGDLLPHCNLSPRGDGNKCAGSCRYVRHIAIYPREGTETLLRCVIHRIVQIAIYPREGTETASAPPNSASHANCNLSPRGDGNGRGPSLPQCPPKNCNLSPRGDGNDEVTPRHHEATLLQFIPARGRKPEFPFCPSCPL